jgi:2',3'-cyclic-nucleotide 2'-phosphodiesterase (5'-nucleotidase family)
MKPKNVVPYKIYELNGVTVAIIGVTTGIAHTTPTGYIMKDPDGLLDVRWETSEIIESIKSMLITPWPEKRPGTCPGFTSY